jgi:DNA-binding response OmpR family regulator
VKVLVIEDEPELNQTVVGFLQTAGYLVESATTFSGAMEKIDDYSYDCIILDIMLPGGSGLELLRVLREDKKNDGVIIVSAKDSLDDKINGIALGADDYLAKPFHLAELAVRVAAIIRRKYFNGQTIVTVGDICIDIQAKTVKVNTVEVELTQKEFSLLLFFITNRNRVLSKNAIVQHLWGDDMDLVDSYDFIYAHIKNLRKKLSVSGDVDYVKSIYGVGYKFQVS